MPKTQYIGPNEEIKKIPVNRGDILSEFFEISDQAREGGMGDVFFCRDRRDNKFYVLKTFKNIACSSDFLKEVKLCLSLPKHRHIVYSRTVISDANHYYLVMEFVGKQPYSLEEKVRGNTLSYVMAHFKLDQKQALIWAIQICKGMEYLKECGIDTHKDLKPDNILITPENEIKISDFGLSALNKRGGTVGYIAPELLRNGSKPTIQSDIYSFGIILYQMLNQGRFPSSENKLDERKIQQAFCSDILQKCLSRDPKDRFENFQELIKVLCQVIKKYFPEYIVSEEYQKSQGNHSLLSHFFPAEDPLAEIVVAFAGQKNLSVQELLLRGIGFYFIKQYYAGFVFLSSVIAKNSNIIEAYKYRYQCVVGDLAHSPEGSLEKLRCGIYLFTFLFGAGIICIFDILVYYLTGWLRVGPVLTVIWALGLSSYLAQYRDSDKASRKWILFAYIFPILMLWELPRKLLVSPLNYIGIIYLTLFVSIFLFVSIKYHIWKWPMRIIGELMRNLCRLLYQLYKYLFKYCFNHDKDRFLEESKGKPLERLSKVSSDLILYREILSLQKQQILDESRFFKNCEEFEQKFDYNSLALYSLLWEKIKFFHLHKRDSQEYNEWKKIVASFQQLTANSPLCLTDTINQSNESLEHNCQWNWNMVKWLALLSYLKVENKDICFLLVRCYLELGDDSAAIHYYQQLECLQEKHRDFNTIDKETNEIVGHFNHYFFDRNKVLYMEIPKIRDTYFYLGRCQKRYGNNKDAFFSFSRAITLESVSENKKILYVHRRLTVPWWKIYKGWLKDSWCYLMSLLP